jgi:hypothetical protein
MQLSQNPDEVIDEEKSVLIQLTLPVSAAYAALQSVSLLAAQSSLRKSFATAKDILVN